MKEKSYKEVPFYTAEGPEIAAMLVEKLAGVDIPARLGSESASAGVFGTVNESRTIWVPENFVKRAKEILTTE